MSGMSETWREARDKVISRNRASLPSEYKTAGGKFMDAFAGKRLRYVPLDVRDITEAGFRAYEMMIHNPDRQYIGRTVTSNNIRFLDRAFRRNGIAVLAEFGCGNGAMTELTFKEAEKANIPANFIFIDRNPVALATTRDRFTSNKLEFKDIKRRRNSPKDETQFDTLPPLVKAEGAWILRFKQADVSNTGLEKDSADVVSCINVLHHLPCQDVTQAGNEIERVTKDGFVILDTGKLSDSFLDRIRLKKIKEVLSLKALVKQTLNAGRYLPHKYQEGYANFGQDGIRAFEQAMTPNQLEELLKESTLASYFDHVSKLKSSNLIDKIRFPYLNLVVGSKSLPGSFF